MELHHNCTKEMKANRLPLSSSYLKDLPSLQNMLEEKKKLSVRDVEKAIKSDIPISEGEYQQMRGGIGSSLNRTLKKAIEVWKIGISCAD